MLGSSVIGATSEELLSSLSLSMDTSALFSHVLLIEDEIPHAKLIMRALVGIVGEVHHVTTGEEALRAVENNLFELVLSDLHLPDFTGLELLRPIRAARPDLPMIVMTSSSSLDDAVNAMREGAWDYMVKDFSADLVDRVKLVIVRTAERKLQQMRELSVRAERDAFWTAVHTAQDGLAILGGSGHVVFANERFLEFCRAANNGPIELPNLTDLIKRHDPGVAEALVAQLKSGHSKGALAANQSSGALWSSDLKVCIPSQTEGIAASDRYFEITLSSVSAAGLESVQGAMSDAGVLRRHVAWVRDITRRKEQEKFQRDLLSTTTHDLKGPLGAILTSAELLENQSTLADKRLQDLIVRIASCARNSINLIDELLSARRIQDGVLVVKPNWYSVPDTLEDIFLDYLPLAKGKNITLSCRPASENFQVFADKLGLHRVLGNLVSNAIKYTDRDGKVEIGAEHSGDTVKFSVSDTGSGIDPKSRSILFERYARLEKHQAIEGTGLGLYVTKNIVDAHNGRIEVTSEVGVGTTFAVYFPDPQKLP